MKIQPALVASDFRCRFPSHFFCFLVMQRFADLLDTVPGGVIGVLEFVVKCRRMERSWGWVILFVVNNKRVHMVDEHSWCLFLPQQQVKQV